MQTLLLLLKLMVVVGVLIMVVMVKTGRSGRIKGRAVRAGKIKLLAVAASA